MITIKSFEVNYFSENTYLLYDDTKEAVLIDCGCLRKEEQKEVSDFIAQNGLTLKRYLCTHLHLDHIFGNEFIHDTYGLSPEAHKADVEGLPSPEEQAKAFGLPMKAKSIYNKKNGFVIVGDSLFAGSIGRTDLWGGNQDILLAAIKDKLLSLPDETVVYPGHGPETRIIDEKLNNPYL